MNYVYYETVNKDGRKMPKIKEFFFVRKAINFACKQDNASFVVNCYETSDKKKHFAFCKYDKDNYKFIEVDKDFWEDVAENFNIASYYRYILKMVGKYYDRRYKKK